MKNLGKKIALGKGGGKFVFSFLLTNHFFQQKIKFKLQSLIHFTKKSKFRDQPANGL